MTTINLDLTKLHGFRLLASRNDSNETALSAVTLPQMLGARLGEKAGIVKVA